MESGRIVFYMLTITLCLAYIRAATLRIYKDRLDEFQVVPVNNSDKLLQCNYFNKSLATVIYTFGYSGNGSTPCTNTVISSYLKTNENKVNVVLLDWTEEASRNGLGNDVGYKWNAVPNAKIVGEQMGQFLIDLIHAGAVESHVHLVGFSLGAHLWGYTGRYTMKYGYVIPRITGLDPTGTFYDEICLMPESLNSVCADFVDVYHLSKYGTNKTVGTVDVWVNCQRLLDNGYQMGCPQGFERFSSDDRCSHDLAWRLYSESVLNSDSFVAAPHEGGCSSWEHGDIQINGSIPVGENIDIGARGNYYLSINSEAPFSKGCTGLKP